jgi:hypothetical protein
LQISVAVPAEAFKPRFQINSIKVKIENRGIDIRFGAAVVFRFTSGVFH